MLINNWYVAAEAAELSDEPMAVRMLGVDLVLFRDGNAIKCLANICCHRGGALARGTVSDGCIACPYHGWTYNGDGVVVKIPALGDHAKIPKRARVDAYPVQERYGYIFVFLGDLSEDERPELPEFLPEYGDDKTWRLVRIKRDWDVNWMRLGENLVDASHLPFVHSFGKHLPQKMNVHEVEESEYGARLAQDMKARQKRDGGSHVAGDELPETRDKSNVDLSFSLVGMMHRNCMQMAPGVTQLLWNAWTPIDEGRTRHFGIQLRTFQMDPESDAPMIQAINYGLDEDASIIEHVEPVVAALTHADELIIETDNMESAFRRKVRQLSAQLGAIDVRKLKEERKFKPLVIPSPGRKADPKNWMHKTVPLLHDIDDEVVSTAAE